MLELQRGKDFEVPFTETACTHNQVPQNTQNNTYTRMHTQTASVYLEVRVPKTWLNVSP